MAHPRFIRVTGYLLIAVGVLLSISCTVYYWNYEVFTRIEVGVQDIIIAVSWICTLTGLFLLISEKRQRASNQR